MTTRFAKERLVKRATQVDAAVLVDRVLKEAGERAKAIGARLLDPRADWTAAGGKEARRTLEAIDELRELVAEVSPVDPKKEP